ncbi:FtsB family cell division protein [Clostridium polynesiense]|uniref:FtsB family cell division protein n=1 Tax=Clostridium polynesiense TaxID=1325933 RepID=UPI00058E3D34|nr:septum formation initiator family protein [Clostridium polynesiense]
MRKKTTLKNLIISFMLIALVYNVVNQQLTMRRIKKQFDEKQVELNSLKMKNDKLKEEVKASQTDPSYMERLARERLGYIKPGENTIVDTPSEANTNK